MYRAMIGQAHGLRRAGAPRLLAVLLAAAVLLSGCVEPGGTAASTTVTRAAPLATDVVVAYSTEGSDRAPDSITGVRGRDGAPVWQTMIGLRENVTPIVVGGVLYTLGGVTSNPLTTGVVAVRLRDGALLWRTRIPDSDLKLTADGTSVVVAGTAGLYVLNPADGSIRWQQAINTIGSPPCVGGGVVVVAAQNIVQQRDGPPMVDSDGLTAFRESDGGVLWQGGVFGSSGIGANQVALYSDTSNQPFARALRDGHHLWSATESGTVIGVSDRLVLVEMSNQQVAALDARTGNVRWQSTQPLDGTLAFGGPVIASGPTSAAVIYGSYKGEVIALRGSDGRELWHRVIPGYAGGTVTGVIAVGGVLFAMLDASPCSLGVFCLGPTNFRLVALDSATGALYWQRDDPNALLLAQAAPTT